MYVERLVILWRIVKNLKILTVILNHIIILNVNNSELSIKKGNLTFNVRVYNYVQFGHAKKHSE
jgi:hypothetical protein